MKGRGRRVVHPIGQSGSASGLTNTSLRPVNMQCNERNNSHFTLDVTMMPGLNLKLFGQPSGFRSLSPRSRNTAVVKPMPMSSLVKTESSPLYVA